MCTSMIVNTLYIVYISIDYRIYYTHMGVAFGRAIIRLKIRAVDCTFGADTALIGVSTVSLLRYKHSNIFVGRTMYMQKIQTSSVR